MSASVASLCFAAAGAPAGAAAPALAPLPVRWDLTPEQITRSCASEIAKTKRRIDAIVLQRSARTFASVIEAYENVNADFGDDLAAQTFLYQVAVDPKVRAASQACAVAAGNVGNEESARPDLYAAIVAASKSGTAVTAADKKLTEMYVIAGRRAGAGLATAQRREFVALEQKINDLETAYNVNLGNDATTIVITPDQAAALPADFTATFKKDPSGGTIVPVNESTVTAFLDNEPDASARKAFWIAYNKRGGRKNVGLLEQALVARARIAALLGYPNWSAYVAADHMAKTPERIATFLANLNTALLPTATSQIAQLSAIKGSPVDPWDVSFYKNQIEKTTYNVDQNEIKQYFPAQHTIDAVVAIYSRILGLTFTLKPHAAAWAPDVYAYDVTDTKTGEYRGRFYLDLFPRPGKYDHFANMGPTARRVMPDGAVRPVVNSIVGNWPAPAPGKPSLLSHDDVITFFHEFGHNVAALCANTPYETLNSGFRLDFVEAPSQMLENFVWDPAILKEISSNVTTGARLPDDLIEKMNAARYFDYAYDTVIQTFYATVDQRYHTLTPPVDTTAVWKRLRGRMTPVPYTDGTTPQGSFGHLMGGYEAGYYGYLWSKVYAQDMFSAFEAGGLESPVVGARYRNDILAPARMIEPDDEVRAFLGRPMRPNAFYQQLGIAVPK